MLACKTDKKKKQKQKQSKTNKQTKRLQTSW
jgi:hypothetical protein